MESVSVQWIRYVDSSIGCFDIDRRLIDFRRHGWIHGPVPVGDPKRECCCPVLGPLWCRILRGDPLCVEPDYLL